MNKRIQELALQAGILPGEMGVKKYTYFDPEKFAQLIVKECAQVLLANKTPLTKDYDDEWYAGYNGAMNNSICYIHEHFGIEE